MPQLTAERAFPGCINRKRKPDRVQHAPFIVQTGENPGYLNA